jgi:hypothetical protein
VFGKKNDAAFDFIEAKAQANGSVKYEIQC